MTWIVLSIIFLSVLAAAVVVFVLARRMYMKTDTSSYSRDGARLTKNIALGIAIACAVLFVSGTLFSSIHMIGQREVGIVTEFGKIVGQTGHGAVFVAPWQSVEKQSIAIEKYHVKKLDCFSEETQNTFVAATLNWHVNPDDVQKLYSQVGPNFFEKIVPNRFYQAFKDETVRYKAVDIAPNREQIRKNVLLRLQESLAAYSIRADDLNIDNLWFSGPFQDAIEAKQKATQDALTAKNKVAQAEFEAKSAAAVAQGVADSQLIQAAANAKAIELEGAALERFPSVMKLRAIEKLNPTVQTILLPATSGFVLPDSLFNQAATGTQK